MNLIHKTPEAQKNNLIYVTPEERKAYEEETQSYFDYWATDKDTEVFTDRYASEYIELILTGHSGVCSTSGRCVDNWLGINSNGDLYPCDRPLGGKYRIGNITEFNSLLEAFNAPNYKNYAYERATKVHDICRKCDVHDYCHGGCPMQDIDETGSAAKPNGYSCIMSKINIMCAYKTLMGVSIDDCNPLLRELIIRRCLILPSEVPEFLELLGIADKFGTLNYSRETADFKSLEFGLFKALNPPSFTGQLVPSYDSYNPESEYVEDTRKERVMKLVEEKAKECLEILSNEKIC